MRVERMSDVLLKEDFGPMISRATYRKKPRHFYESFLLMLFHAACCNGAPSKYLRAMQ